MTKYALALAAIALSLAGASSASAHMTKSHAATMKRCHAMSHSAMMKNRSCVAMMKMHGSSMGSHPMMKHDAMKSNMTDKGSMSSEMMGNSSMPKNN